MPIHVTANYIQLSLEQDKGVHEYEVSFQPNLESKTLRIKFLNSQIAILGGVKMFDGGSCLYLPIKLREIKTTLSIKNTYDNTIVLITITYKRNKRFSECSHLFNTLFKRIMTALSFHQINKGYFDMSGGIMVPAHKLEILPGYVISVDEYEGGLMLCLDVQHRVLRTQTVWDLLVHFKLTSRVNFRSVAVDNIVGAVVLTRYFF